MALTDAEWSAAAADIFARQIAGTITQSQAATELATATANWPTRTLSNADLSARIVDLIASINNPLSAVKLSAGAPGTSFGDPGELALDYVNGAIYGPKATSGTVWPLQTSLKGPQGEAGPQGAAGPQGVQGPTGPVGAAGPQGAAGAVGAKGDTGAEGPQGPAGQTGAQGPIGAQGERGLQGEIGPQGLKGDTGDSGPVGATGPQGPTGEIGPQGPTGATGATGTKGDRGEAFNVDATGPIAGRAAYDAQGDGFSYFATDEGLLYFRQGAAGVWSEGIAFGKGETGDTGPAGPTGAAGATGAAGPEGLSAYQVALAAGFSGSLSAWLASLVGAQGLQGATGAKGDTGAQGVQGPQGVQGVQGPTGDTGPAGATGPAGSDATVVRASGAELRALADDTKVLTPKAVADAAALVTLTDASTIAVDLAAGVNFVVTLAGNRTLGAPTNAKPGMTGTIHVKQDATGSRTLAYASAWMPFGSTPSLTTTANAVDLLTFIVETSGKVRFSLAKGGAA